jgi:hypothetical protein
VFGVSHGFAGILFQQAIPETHPHRRLDLHTPAVFKGIPFIR